MATLHVSYFSGIRGSFVYGPIKDEQITTSGTSASTGVFPANARAIKFSSSASHFVTIGQGSPTASAGALGTFHIEANEQLIVIAPEDVIDNQYKAAAITP